MGIAAWPILSRGQFCNTLVQRFWFCALSPSRVRPARVSGPRICSSSRIYTPFVGPCWAHKCKGHAPRSYACTSPCVVVMLDWQCSVGFPSSVSAFLFISPYYGSVKERAAHSFRSNFLFGGTRAICLKRPWPR